jgi:hypothetical protein
VAKIPSWVVHCESIDIMGKIVRGIESLEFSNCGLDFDLIKRQDKN